MSFALKRENWWTPLTKIINLFTSHWLQLSWVHYCKRFFHPQLSSLGWRFFFNAMLIGSHCSCSVLDHLQLLPRVCVFHGFVPGLRECCNALLVEWFILNSWQVYHKFWKLVSTWYATWLKSSYSTMHHKLRYYIFHYVTLTLNFSSYTKVYSLY